ncbi:MAG: GAF domain-containing protein [Bacteroidales bacterium]|nr:GAF domain-containing protein [Bacteroidales bacterium]
MTTKEEKYTLLLKQVQALIEGETDAVANMANISALLYDTFHFWWVGFYLVRGEQLVLGPFQGPVACTRIEFGKGVCGTSWKEQRTIIVPDVEEFPGHIACSSLSRSEIVVPIKRDNEVIGVIDIDSEHLNTFDETDAKQLERLTEIMNNWTF